MSLWVYTAVLFFESLEDRQAQLDNMRERMNKACSNFDQAQSAGTGLGESLSPGRFGLVCDSQRSGAHENHAAGPVR